MESDYQMKILLEKKVDQARARLATDCTNGVRIRAYAKALIRLNGFLMKEAALLHFEGRPERIRI